MSDKYYSITFKMPKIEGNRITLSWEPNLLFTKDSYIIEYLDVKDVQCSTDSLVEAYLPICIAFSTLGNVKINLPAYVDPKVLEAWKRVCESTTSTLCKNTASLEFIVPPQERNCAYEEKDLGESALLFGGGSESLLMLARLLDKNISPYLISIWGSHWDGSDLELNRDRFDLEEGLCRQFKLKIIRIFTDIKEIIDSKKFAPYLKRPLYIVDAMFFLPMAVSFVLPIAEQYNIGTIISGNEEHNAYDTNYYSFCPEMTRNLKAVSRNVRYESHLEEMTKMQVIEELHLKYLQFARYQYSCWRSIRQRWCLKCEKCLRNYLIYNILDIDPTTVGMDEGRLLENLPDAIPGIKKSIRRSRILFKEWGPIRHEAMRRGEKEVIKIIDSFYGNVFLREVNYFLRGQYKPWRQQ